MKRTTLFAALASAISLSAYAHDQARMQSSQNDQSQQQSASAQQNQGQQNSDLVKQAQEKLSADGKDIGTADGQLGPKTQAALQEFQQENGLPQSGQLDRETIAALDLGEGSTAASGGTSSSYDSDMQQPNDTGTNSVTGETQE